METRFSKNFRNSSSSLRVLVVTVCIIVLRIIALHNGVLQLQYCNTVLQLQYYNAVVQLQYYNAVLEFRVVLVTICVIALQLHAIQIVD